MNELYDTDKGMVVKPKSHNYKTEIVVVNSFDRLNKATTTPSEYTFDIKEKFHGVVSAEIISMNYPNNPLQKYEPYLYLEVQQFGENYNKRQINPDNTNPLSVQFPLKAIGTIAPTRIVGNYRYIDDNADQLLPIKWFSKPKNFQLLNVKIRNHKGEIYDFTDGGTYGTGYAISRVVVTDGGSGHTDGTYTITDFQNLGANFNVVVQNTTVVRVDVTENGAGYDNADLADLQTNLGTSINTAAGGIDTEVTISLYDLSCLTEHTFVVRLNRVENITQRGEDV
uniref:Uncharacterized protein n=1 Tax=viral metagenome TaxID=1070528 RepID=A0A6C0CK89_9ZZZZ